MNLIRSASRVRWALLVLSVIFLRFPALAQTSPTNKYPPWPALTNLVQKYDKMTMTDVEALATQGEETAQHYLGYTYIYGLRGPVDIEKGVGWYKKAISQNYLPSAFNLAGLYDGNVPGNIDKAKALFYYQYAADRGYVRAKLQLGLHYRDADGVTPNPALAMKFLEEAANAGNAEAMFELFHSYLDGLGVARDYAKAIRWLRQGADAQDGRSLSELAFEYERGDPSWGTSTFGPGTNMADLREKYSRFVVFTNFPDDESRMHEALRLEEVAASKGWVSSSIRLADFYFRGVYVEQDEARAVKFLQDAADEGSADAMSRLAGCYAQGIGEPRNENDRPFALLCRALGGFRWTLQEFEIYKALMDRCAIGQGTERDLVAAAQWYSRAAIHPVTDYFGRAMFPLRDKLEQGPHDRNDDYTIAVPDEVRPVLVIYLKAAAQQDGESAMALGEMYMTGNDAPRNPAKAWPWFKLAEQYGAAKAGAMVAQAEKRMTDNELDQARREYAGFLEELKKVAAIATSKGP